MGSYKKKLFIVLLLFSLISCFVCSSVNATGIYQSDDTYNVNVPELLKQEQELLANIYFMKAKQINNTNFLTNLKNRINSNEFWYYFTYTKDIGSSRYGIHLYLLPTNFSFATMDNYEIYTSKALFYDDYITLPFSGYTFTGNDLNITIYEYDVFLSNNTVASVNGSSNILTIPTFLIYYQNSTVLNFGNDIYPNTNLWGMLTNAINENTEATEDTTQAVNNLRNDFNAEESDDDYDFPTDNPTTDPTSSGIDNIFNMFYMRINSWNALGINVPIPFTGKSFSISPDITENIINGWTPTTQIATVFKTLLSGVWYYLLGRYIVKDVQHYVDGLQTGDILTKSDTNIKTEML